MNLLSPILVMIFGVIITRVIKFHHNKIETNWKNELIECSTHFTASLIMFIVIMILIS
jgi:hypothetical protein